MISSLFKRIKEPKQSSAAPIGIDCGSRLLKAVQLHPDGDSFRVAAAAVAEVPDGATDDPAALGQFFRRTVRRMLQHGFTGRQITLALPSHHMYAASVRRDHGDELGSLSGDDGADCDWLPFSGADAVVQNVEVGDVHDGGRRRREVVSIAVPRRVVDRYVIAATEAGFEVVGMASAAEAVLSALAATGADSRMMRLVVDLGLSGTRVYAGVGRRLMFARQLAVGGRHIEQAVAASLGVSREEACALRSRLPSLDSGETVADENLRRVDEACAGPLGRLVAELQMCQHYVAGVFGGIPVHHVVFVGGGAKHVRLCQRLARGMGLPARAADPLARLARRGQHDEKFQQNLTQRGPLWAVAAGLSIYGASAVRARSGAADADPWYPEEESIARFAGA